MEFCVHVFRLGGKPDGSIKAPTSLKRGSNFSFPLQGGFEIILFLRESVLIRYALGFGPSDGRPAVGLGGRGARQAFPGLGPWPLRVTQGTESIPSAT